MDMEEKLKRINMNAADPGSVGGIDLLLRRAKQFKVPGLIR